MPNNAPKSIKQLVSKWTDHHFTLDSGIYAGRPPMYADLNEEILEMFYQGIRAEMGSASAENFVRFVDRLEDLSASSFIVAFKKFWESGCTEICVSQSPEDRNGLTALEGEGREVQGLCLLGTVLYGNKKSAEEIMFLSMSIKFEFLARHPRLGLSS